MKKQPRKRWLNSGGAKILSKYLDKRSEGLFLVVNMTANMMIPTNGGARLVPIVGWQEIKLHLPTSWGKITKERLGHIQVIVDERLPDGEYVSADLRWATQRTDGRPHRSSRWYPEVSKFNPYIHDIGERPIYMDSKGIGRLREALADADLPEDVRARLEREVNEVAGPPR